jgi:hypothetical protein
VGSGWLNASFIHNYWECCISAALNLQRIYAWVHNRTVQYRPLYVLESELIQLPARSQDFADWIYKFHTDRYNDSKRQVWDGIELWSTFSTTFRTHHVIVDIRERSRQQVFLDALRQTSLKSPEHFHYVMATFVSC